MNKKLKIIVWYLFFIYFLGFLALSATMAQLNPAPRYHVFGAVDKIFADMSFWTTQTNWMFIIFFLFVALDGKWGIWKPGKVAWINFLAYFTLTMTLFWSALSATLSNQDIETNPLVSYANVYDSFMKWFITVTTHLVTYIIAISYYIIAVKKEKIDIKNWYKRDLLIGWIYPLFYLFFVMIRFLIMKSIGADHYLENIPEKELQWLIDNDYQWVRNLGIGELSTPYFFFNPLVEKNGLELLILGSIGCLLLITACQYLMIWVNNLFIKENKKEIKKIQFKLSKCEIVFSIMKIIISFLLISLAIWKLTIFDNYDFKEKIPVLYYFVYPLLYLIVLISNIMTIIYTILKIRGKYENPTMEFLSSIFSGLFILQIYAISLLMAIPIILENKYNRKKIPSNI
ncbi:hypothetical protein [Spiroplasma monobiae]|uniref:Transmembrane protein n=1 Tax=Spiroplasma monobiae MQ-1 TaxID=1336748 RepID=A0A2K9LTI5_SPISQ|nr:hypothetical protein [Spiroplasma monobiae]AUM62406.1 hypothetical protein SMONO_v1c01550 [Spiroplasma monobiae MQ-1]